MSSSLVKKLGYILLSVMACAAYSCTGHGLIPDGSPAALAAGDFTALIEIEGCGRQPQVQEGYAYCRMNEGPVGNLAVTFIAPPQATKCDPHACVPGDKLCDPTSCVDFMIYYPSGAPAYGNTIPHGQTSVTVPWTTLTGKSVFTPDDTGFWIYTYTIRWQDPAGNTEKTVSDGEIRLRVIRTLVCDVNQKCQAYEPLRNVPDNANFVWSWQEGNQTIRMTTAARTYVSF